MSLNKIRTSVDCSLIYVQTPSEGKFVIHFPAVNKDRFGFTRPMPLDQKISPDPEVCLPVDVLTTGNNLQGCVLLASEPVCSYPLYSCD
jgi:hypothetical protein